MKGSLQLASSVGVQAFLFFTVVDLSMWLLLTMFVALCADAQLLRIQDTTWRHLLCCQTWSHLSA